MKIDCEIIMDLLPLYIENIASQKSRGLVEEHILECESCKQAMSLMKESEPQIVHDVEPIKNFKKRFRKHTITVAAISVFILVAIYILVYGMFFLQPGDEMGYSILCFYLGLPFTAFVCSIVAGVRESRIKWFLPLIFGVIGAILPFAIFQSMDMICVFFALIPSIIGLVIGVVVGVIVKKTKHKY